MDVLAVKVGPNDHTAIHRPCMPPWLNAMQKYTGVLMQ